MRKKETKEKKKRNISLSFNKTDKGWVLNKSKKSNCNLGCLV